MSTQTALVPNTPTPALFIAVPDGASKDVKSRVEIYNQWLAVNPTGDLAAYRDYLLNEYVGKRDKAVLSESSVKAHLATIRARYSAMLQDNDLRRRLYAAAPDTDAANRKAFVDEYLTQLANSIDPKKSAVKVETVQDRPDDYGRRLTKEQASALLAAPQNRRGNTRLMILRDTAIIALMLWTGIREAELCALDVQDISQQFEGEKALHVRKGKGNNTRLIPYGDSPALVIVQQWLDAADITTGAVFRGIYRGGKRVRSERIRVCAINRILDNYPIIIEGEQITVNPHDLRRTYARRLYEADVKILSIQQNLGHKNHQTTEHYIGNVNASERRPPALYTFDLRRFGKV